MNFNDFNISDDLKKAVEKRGFSNPTSIQKQSIPPALEGRDILGQAQTGSGKTLAFLVPVIDKIFIPDRSVQCIILCPTRELCIQIENEISKLKIKKLKSLAVYGGQSIGKQTRVLKKGVHIIVGTPGRVIDHINRETFECVGIERVVLDECDEMLNMGFKEDIEFILSKIPHQHQTMLFSATIPREIKKIASDYLKQPEFIKVSRYIPDIKQYYSKTPDKREALITLIELYNPRLTLVFCNTKKRVNFLLKFLKEHHYAVDAIHGDMTQKVRDKVMNKFRNSNISILIASDVAARGLDIDNIDLVVNYDFPQNSSQYIHRIGRTARAGKNGHAFSLISKKDEFYFSSVKNQFKLREKILPDRDNLNLAMAERIIGDAFNNSSSDYEKMLKNYSRDDLVKISAGLLKLLREK